MPAKRKSDALDEANEKENALATKYQKVDGAEKVASTSTGKGKASEKPQWKSLHDVILEGEEEVSFDMTRFLQVPMLTDFRH